MPATSICDARRRRWQASWLAASESGAERSAGAAAMSENGTVPSPSSMVMTARTARHPRSWRRRTRTSLAGSVVARAKARSSAARSSRWTSSRMEHPTNSAGGRPRTAPALVLMLATRHRSSSVTCAASEYEAAWVLGGEVTTSSPGDGDLPGADSKAIHSPRSGPDLERIAQPLTSNSTIDPSGPLKRRRPSMPSSTPSRTRRNASVASRGRSVCER